MGAVIYAGLTDRGRIRKQNEDCWLAEPQQGLYLVSDGMGGESAGALASKIVVEVLPPLLRKRMKGIGNMAGPEVKEQVLAALAELSGQVRHKSKDRPGLDGMGATVVLALIRERQALIAHMGDSRAYLLRQGRLKQLTRDHSITELLIESGEITTQEAAEHPARGQLTRYVGMRGEALPEAHWLALFSGDCLLLCSDGLTGMVNDAGLLTILQEKGNPQTSCQRLIAAANAAGGTDNVTALIVSMSSGSE